MLTLLKGGSRERVLENRDMLALALALALACAVATPSA